MDFDNFIKSSYIWFMNFWNVAGADPDCIVVFSRQWFERYQFPSLDVRFHLSAFISVTSLSSDVNIRSDIHITKYD